MAEHSGRLEYLEDAQVRFLPFRFVTSGHNGFYISFYLPPFSEYSGAFIAPHLPPSSKRSGHSPFKAEMRVRFSLVVFVLARKFVKPRITQRSVVRYEQSCGVNTISVPDNKGIVYRNCKVFTTCRIVGGGINTDNDVIQTAR